MSMMITLSARVNELVLKHGSFRIAARAVQVDSAYLFRLWKSEKVNPSASTLRKLGLRRVVTYTRII